MLQSVPRGKCLLNKIQPTHNHYDMNQSFLLYNLKLWSILWWLTPVPITIHFVLCICQLRSIAVSKGSHTICVLFEEDLDCSDGVVPQQGYHINLVLLFCPCMPYLPASQQICNTCIWCYHVMTSSNGDIFRITGHLCGEFIGPRWIPRTKASDAELWCFLWSASQ